MGVYLNSKSAYTLYKNESKKPYFIDKSLMLSSFPGHNPPAEFSTV